MTLRDVIADLNCFDANHVIYVAQCTADANAVVDCESQDGDPPTSATGMHYLLEISLARDALRVWSEWRDGLEPTLDDKIKAVIYYAENDAFIPAD